MKTALYEAHRALGAKMVDFGGWEMPIQYKGIVQEHLTVRQRVGIFDVSHMGRILVEGKDAEKMLDYLSTNTIVGKKDGTATYTVWCHPSGTCVDDLIIYKEKADRFFLVVNASNREKDLAHLQQYANDRDLKITARYHEDGILAVQGPQAETLIVSIFPEARNLQSMHLTSAQYKGIEIVISFTGYTGAGGFEICGSNETIVELWHLLLREGMKYGIEPIGLGARDTLRLEMGYALYGHEISEEIAPIESVSAWTVKWDKEDFLGKDSLERLKGSSKKRAEYGIVMQDKGIPREGYEVFHQENHIGKVTSGTFSPSLNQAIAIVLVEKNLKEGDSVDVMIRQNACRAIVTKLPFYKKL